MTRGWDGSDEVLRSRDIPDDGRRERNRTRNTPTVGSPQIKNVPIHLRESIADCRSCSCRTSSGIVYPTREAGDRETEHIRNRNVHIAVPIPDSVQYCNRPGVSVCQRHSSCNRDTDELYGAARHRCRNSFRTVRWTMRQIDEDVSLEVLCILLSVDFPPVRRDDLCIDDKRFFIDDLGVQCKTVHFVINEQLIEQALLEEL